MDPSANDITQLELLKRNLLLLKDRAGEHGLIALKVLPKDLLHLLTEKLSDAALSKIKGQH